MLTFLAPSLLVAAPAAAALGLWALWRGRHHVQRVSSTRLWAGLAGEAAGKRARAIDPVWLLVFLAAVLAGVALAGPQWVAGAGAGREEKVPGGKVSWSMRGLAGVGGAGAELFVRVSGGVNLPESCAIRWDDEDAEGRADGGERFSREVMVKTAELERGTVVEAGNAPVEHVVLKAGGGGVVLAEARFVRRDRAAFALLTSTGRGAGGGKVDAAWWHLFGVHPAVEVGDPTVRPAVLLVDDPRFRVEEVDDRTLVVASPRTPMPGIKVEGGAATEPAEGGATAPAGVVWTATDAAAKSERLGLGAVRVRRYVRAEVSGDWQVLATVEGRPWIAERIVPGSPGGSARRWVWLASNPAGDSNWGVDVSFVLFFGELLDQMYPVGGGGDSRVTEWAEHRTPGPAAADVRTYSCVPALGTVVVGLLLLATLLLVRRGRVGGR